MQAPRIECPERTVIVSNLGLTHYEPVLSRMQAFTRQRGLATFDEIWFTEHEPVFTQGQAGKPEHVLAAGDIPIVQSDRGGQVTYHGPGQITAYLMFDLGRLQVSVRELVKGIEQAMIKTLAFYGIRGEPRSGAPGVYVAGDKIGSLGLRLRRGCSYHGLSLNVDMDLEPFTRINPCGLFGLQVTHMAQHAPVDIAAVRQQLTSILLDQYELTLHAHQTPQMGQS